MEKGRLFSNDKIGYEEYLKKVGEMVEKGSIICKEEELRVGIDALTKIDDEERRRKMISSSYLVDKEFNIPYERTNGHIRKLPIIMTIANMVGNYYDKVKDLSSEELLLLGNLSYVVGINSMEEHLNLFGNKPLLESVMKKTANIEERNTILRGIETSYFKLNIDKDDNLSLNKFRDEMISRINASPKEELLGMARTIDEVLSDIKDKGYRF